MNQFLFLKQSLRACNTSKCERYLLKEFANDVCFTLATLHNCKYDNSELVVDGVTYYFSDYSLPTTKIKNVIEQTRVYLNAPAIQLAAPLLEAKLFNTTVDNSDEDSTSRELGKLMSPEALNAFFEQYYSFKRNENISMQPISKDKTVTLFDLSLVASPINDSELRWINNGGTKVDEDICYLNQFTLPVDVCDYARQVSEIDTERAKYSLF